MSVYLSGCDSYFQSDCHIGVHILLMSLNKYDARKCCLAIQMHFLI